MTHYFYVLFLALIGRLRHLIGAQSVVHERSLQVQAENAILRHQIAILRRQHRRRVRFVNWDRLTFGWVLRLFSAASSALVLVKPATVIAWHRKGFRAYWRWKSRNHGGRPPVDARLRALILRMARDNPLWGAPRLHGELLKLGFSVAQSTVSRYMPRRRAHPGPGWKTFIDTHKDAIAAIDLFCVPTLNFKPIYGLAIISLHRRKLLWTNAIAHPTAAWIAAQLHEAFPWETTLRYLIRDRDGCYGSVFKTRLAAMNIRDHPIAPRRP